MRNRATNQSRSGFTLIELLTVIAIIGVLVAFSIPVLRGIQRREKIAVTKAELSEIQTALENYKTQYGFYPPSNGAGPAGALNNQLYYELSGVTPVTNNSVPCYQVLHGSSIVGRQFYGHLFNVGGVVNSANQAGEDSVPARSFLSLKPNQIGTLPVTNNYGGYHVNYLIASVGGSDEAYQPMGFPGLNPFRYLAPGAAKHNVNGYDLWVQLVISGETNLICNWNENVTINSPLP